jgi:hypothetical protein
MPPTIIISAYNRPQALAHLLGSLEKAHYPTGSNVHLIISIDHGPDGIHKGVLDIAQAFVWNAGQKEIIEQPERLGLVKHVMACGRLSGQVGDIIFLEDDLLVSPSFYAYATQALDFYRDDERIAGHCLYSLWFNGYTQQLFVPIQDGGDSFYVQVPYTQGQAFTAKQWAAMDAWIAAEPAHKPAAALLHDSFSRFDSEDWFPSFARYAVGAGRFTVYPRVSLTTGTGDPGVHFTHQSNFFEVPLQRGKTRFAFKSFDDADAIYDSFFEILPSRLNRLTEILNPYDYSVDLYATKSARQLDTDYTLTTRSASRSMKTFGQQRWPMEMNVVDNVSGDAIRLCQTGDIDWGSWADLETHKQNHGYFSRNRRLSRWLRLKFALVVGWRWLRGGRSVP